MNYWNEALDKIDGLMSEMKVMPIQYYISFSEKKVVKVVKKSKEKKIKKIIKK